MQTAPSFRHALPLPHLEEVSALLRDHLQGDWIVRIEHLNPRDRLRTLWRTWGRTRYVRQGTEAVMDSILDCHLAHPQHSIRLCAERMRPETRLVYWIYDADPEDEARAATARMAADCR